MKNHNNNNYKSTADPSVWGPSFWLSLHNGAVRYPVKASPTYQHRMKGFILGIPYMLPCDECRQHALAFIDSRASQLDSIVSGRHNLFNYFVDFHNQVNARYGKPLVSYEQAYKLYSSPVKVYSSN